jgi:hypothetical protein
VEIPYNLPFKEIIMGRPIKKSWFGLPNVAPGTQILIDGVKFADGTTSVDGYIVKQNGADSYIVQDVGQTHAAEKCFMVNATSVSGLLPGQCFINATPFGGSARPCSKIMQYRLDLYEANGTIGSYSWSTRPAAAAGQADLVGASDPAAPTNSVAPVVSGTTTAGSTLTTTNGTWTGSPLFTYQWTLDGVNVGTGVNTYLIPAGAAGRLIICKVTGTNSGGALTVNSNTITTT